MNILMLNPPFHPNFSRTSRSPAVSKSGTLYYPIWLAYATGVLEKEGFNVKLIDAPADDLNLGNVLKIIKDFKPGLIIIDTSTPSIINDIKVVDSIKKNYDSFLTLVGTHVSALPEESMQMSENIDAIARHEYDYTICELAKALESGRELEHIDGLTFKKNGEVIHNPDRELIKNLDELPFASKVYKRHLSVENYFYAANLYPEITIVTGRGCPHRCVYCVLPQVMNGHQYRVRSIENVVDEMEYIKTAFPQVKEIFFEDDTMTVNAKRAQRLCDEIIKRRLKMTWSANSRADVNLETLKKMKAAGCRLLCVGFESGDQTVLNNIGKRLTVAQIREFSANAKKAGIMIHGCFLVGNPGETKETLRKTLQLAKEIKPDTAQFFPIMVYPGTRAYEWAKESGYLMTEDYSEWLTDDGLHNCVVSQPELTKDELVQFCDDARREYYLRPGYMAFKLGQTIKHPKEAQRTLKSAKTFVKYLFHNSNK